MEENKTPSRLFARSFAALFAVVAAALLYGGGTLVALGGSFYYLIAGIAVAATAVLLWRGDILAATVYGVFLLASLAWALWEAGADGWALAPRLIGPAVLGVAFALPAVRRKWNGDVGASMAAGLPVYAGVLMLLVQAGVGLWPESHQVSEWKGQTAAAAPAAGDGEWAAWGRTVRGDKFAPLTQITPENVDKLEVAWTYHTGVKQDVPTPLEATPLAVGDKLFLCTQTNEVVAIDPDTGRQIWRFDPKVNGTGGSVIKTCRGVAYYRDQAAADCRERIITTTFDARLMAVDAATGKPCAGFGKNGAVDLRRGMGLVAPGFYYGSSAPLVANGLVVVGGFVADNQTVDAPSGAIRAFDAKTGALRWAWDLGNPQRTGEPAEGEVYTRATPNSWATLAADEDLGLVYVPLGNPSPDMWGGHRSPAAEKYGSSLVALDLATGREAWSFQTTHHDLWDYDLASQPTLVDVPVNGGVAPAVIQATKRGETFVLDRRTGQPIVPVEERPAPTKGAAPGERISPTQPYSAMPSLSGGRLRERDMWGLTPLDQLWCRVAFRRARYEGSMNPPGVDTSLIYPAIGGGMNWGGVSVDPERGIMVASTLNVVNTLKLVPRAETDRRIAAAKTRPTGHSFDLPQPMLGTPYGAMLSAFFSPLKTPCNEPPFGRLSAIDLKTKTLLWSRPIGSASDTGPFGMPSHLPLPMGMPLYAGSITTRSGLVFIAATQDAHVRAFDLTTGKTLWQAPLPAMGHANPMTFVSPKTGRQYVVIAASGFLPLGAKLSDSVVAYALPH